MLPRHHLHLHTTRIPNLSPQPPSFIVAAGNHCSVNRQPPRHHLKLTSTTTHPLAPVAQRGAKPERQQPQTITTAPGSVVRTFELHHRAREVNRSTPTSSSMLVATPGKRKPPWKQPSQQQRDAERAATSLEKSVRVKS
ncbi:hypothetical protein DEO72_LG1g2614 [Vigna unguiculata]|uniref:Uncharacterized protein n=1 Tax=Vigna unguiculata TaxID=3917 RepID=A0A4D6KT75_VIGUN|nr:hypothetical protein DEO72_LG1g2614 [Vigna unguiculata]